MLKRAYWFGLVGALVAAAFGATTTAGCQATCASSDECADGEFCSMAVGVCASSKALGFCKPIPDSCPTVTQTVCGCDGKTYANSCDASLKRQSVAQQGTCNLSCGGPSKAKCPAGSYCKYDDGVCASETTAGTCETIPSATACATAVPAPVCGCDLKTYDSRCDAQAAGVSVAADGACNCGGPKDTACEAGRYCSWAMGSCGASQPAGACEVVPKSCAAFSAPVCGCDQVTYENGCEAAKAKMSIWAEGGCDCATGLDCPDGYYCLFGMVGACFTGGKNGTCTKIPDVTVCSTVQDAKVCGCDGKEYKNTCFAAAQGTSVGSTGACTSMGTGGGGQ